MRGKEASEEASSSPSIFRQALLRSIGGGTSGLLAMGIQITTMMWLHTTMNYQYRYGTTTLQAVKTLYRQGGFLRFYKGFLAAAVEAPIARFGDTAANSGVILYLNRNPSTRDLSIPVKTCVASFMASAWRVLLMPLDSIKTFMQVEGKYGIKKLKMKVKTSGFSVMFHGSVAASAANFLGHFGFFLTYNYIDSLGVRDKISKPHWIIVWNGLTGFLAASMGAVCSNSVKVIKTYKQTHATGVSYSKAMADMIAKEGFIGFASRGLLTRVYVSGMQGLVFVILWRLIDEKFFLKTERH